MTKREEEIVNDVKKIGHHLKKDQSKTFAKGEYFGHSQAKFSSYDIYEGGKTWTYYCNLAGFQTKAKPERDDKYYFDNLQRAIDFLGRLPKTSERKKYGLNFSKSRWPTLDEFIKIALNHKFVSCPCLSASNYIMEDSNPTISDPVSFESVTDKNARIVPPIPILTRRKKWERTNIVGFPYAPQDESGVVAIFAILCYNKTIPWQILELNAGKGIDSICFDEKSQKEIRIELKFNLSRASWNHSFDMLDYLVCWESKWKDFPKSVIELKNLIDSKHLT